uniref:Reverse transcriptase domain-containing protein n=1 Tax=Aegilops tauschii subsp. strangulata TaxID=200361 RepID=A0A453EL27_AEGTS
IPTISLYADDVILLCHPSPDDIVAVKEILQLFGRASGLHVNFQKSVAALIRCDIVDAAHAVAHLGCPIVEFPLTYLGIPLTLRRPTAAQLQPVVDKVAGKLPFWKAWLMNKAGRLAFVKAVLSAIPIHQLLVLAPPKKTIKLLEKIERGFLWAGRAEANGGNCHVNWRRVCRPIQLGGLGVHDLERTGLALRMRWQWLSRVDDSRAWSGLDLQFAPEERALFFASTTMSIGNGQHALFWEDRWINGRAIREIAPLLYALIPKRRRKSRTVADGLHANQWATDIHGMIGIPEIGEYLSLWHRLAETALCDAPDCIRWKWTANGEYSAKS